MEQSGAAWHGLAAGNSLLIPNIKCIKPGRHHKACLQLTHAEETEPSALQLHPVPQPAQGKGTNGISYYKVLLLMRAQIFVASIFFYLS